MRKISVLFTFLLLSICSWAQKTRDMSHEGSSGDVFVGYSLLNGDTLSHASGWEAALTGNFNDWFGLKADLGGNYKSFGGGTAREYNIRSRFESVVTLPTDERVVGEPRCCWSATAGGKPSI